MGSATTSMHRMGSTRYIGQEGTHPAKHVEEPATAASQMTTSSTATTTMVVDRMQYPILSSSSLGLTSTPRSKSSFTTTWPAAISASNSTMNVLNTSRIRRELSKSASRYSKRKNRAFCSSITHSKQLSQCFLVQVGIILEKEDI